MQVWGRDQRIPCRHVPLETTRPQLLTAIWGVSRFFADQHQLRSCATRPVAVRRSRTLTGQVNTLAAAHLSLNQRMPLAAKHPGAAVDCREILKLRKPKGAFCWPNDNEREAFDSPDVLTVFCGVFCSSGWIRGYGRGHARDHGLMPHVMAVIARSWL